MTDPHDGNLAEQLRRLLLAVEASGRAVLPGSNLELLQSIVEAAARIFGAAAASIALVDEQAQELEFKVSYGAGSDEVVGMRIPLDTGIAGYVAMTGQPIAISDVQQDARFNRAFAGSTGYVPRSILATPLVYRERVLGVMEVLDKISASSFGLQDMELLGMFARQAAIAIDQSQQVASLTQLLVQGLRRLAVSDTGAVPDELLAVLEHSGDAASPDDVRTRDLLALADRFNAISELGEAERLACLQILAVFGDYARARRDLPV
ncbi:MAG: GAF domain-containing protein [Chloroflexi bacterium]|nr:GAF domain-containing protein [Chloroflexota bacterium]